MSVLRRARGGARTQARRHQARRGARTRSRRHQARREAGTRTRSRQAWPARVAVLALLLLATGCITQFRTAAPLAPEETRLVASDLAVAGVLARKPGEPGTPSREAALHLASISGARDGTAEFSPDDLVLLLASPSSIHAAADRLRVLEERIGNRFVLVGEASTAPTDEFRSWIIQIVLPIPFIWISFGIPVNYAANPDVPHATTSTRIIDLRRAEIVSAYFQIDAKIDPEDTPSFRPATAARALQRMALTSR